MGEYPPFLITLAILAAILFTIGRALAGKIGIASERRRVHGLFVLWWSLSGFVLGGVSAPLISDPIAYGGMAGFGLLVGWLIGTIHGGLVLAYRAYRGSKADSDMVAPIK